MGGTTARDRYQKWEMRAAPIVTGSRFWYFGQYLPSHLFRRTTFPIQMLSLYKRLSEIGLTRPYLRDTALPKWWDDEAAETPAGYAEALLHLSRHMGLALATLQDPSKPLALRNFGPCKFKKTTGTTDDDLAMARAIGTRAAQMAAIATTDQYAGVPSSATEVRLRILDCGAPYVSLNHLLCYCWSIGIPVLFLSRFPNTAKKMHGMSAMFKGRPVIVLCKRVKRTAWLLFVLAHELGHIACGHLSDGSVLIDQDINRNERDGDEDQANAFALELITGAADFNAHASARWPSATDLARLAQAYGQRHRIDPGHIVLNYAHTMGATFWPVAQAALKEIEPGGNGPALVREMMAAKLDWSALPKDSSRFLMRVTETGP